MSNLQKFIDLNFYRFFILALILCALFYNIIRFKVADELLSLLLIGFYFFVVSKKREWPVNKFFAITLSCFLFYTCYSFFIASNSTVAIFSDLLIQLKPYLAFFIVYELKPNMSLASILSLKKISVYFWLLLFPIGILGAYDLSFYKAIIEHPTNYGAAMVALSILYLYCSNYSLKDKIIFIVMLSFGLLSGRSKFYGFFVLASFFVLYFDNIDKMKLNLKTSVFCLIMLLAMFLVAKEKLELYFIESLTGEEKDLMARYVLYATSILIFVDYFPFGSGLASFATHTSGLYYSKIYSEYGIDNVWGLERTGWDFIADTYYPSLAQFGLVGVLLFILFWIYIIRKQLSYVSIHKDMKYIIVSVLIIGFILIENVADAAFTSNRGFFMMLFLGLILSNSKEKAIDSK